MAVLFTGSSSHASSSRTWCRDTPKAKAGAHFSNNCAPQGSVCYEWECDSFFFLLEWKNSALWLSLSLLLLPPLPTCTAYITRLHATSSCLLSRGRQVGSWGNMADNCSRSGGDELGRGKVAAAKMLMCLFCFTSDVQGDYLLCALWCLRSLK